MPKPVKKEGYETTELADEKALACFGTQIQLVRFLEGKYEHYHKKKTEFFYFLKGKGKVLMEGKEIPLQEGVSVLVKPGVKHTFIRESREPLEAIMFKTNSSPDDTFTD